MVKEGPDGKTKTLTGFDKPRYKTLMKEILKAAKSAVVEYKKFKAMDYNIEKYSKIVIL